MTIHDEPDRDGDFAHGLRVALYAEGLVVVAIMAAAALNLRAILEYFDSLGSFF